MQFVKHNLSPAKKEASKASRLFVALLLISFQVLPSAHAISDGKLKALPGFQASILAVAMVNKAMREAALNPMDRWRRNSLRSALQMLPPALMALSADFKSGKAHNADLPKVQGILGAFVDLKAPDLYNQFLKNPQMSMIPSLSPNFPKEAVQQAEAQSATYGYEEGRTAQPANAVTAQEAKPKVSEDVVDLESALARPKKIEKPSAPQASVTYDENAQAPKSEKSFADTLAADITAIETGISNNRINSKPGITSNANRAPAAEMSKGSRIIMPGAEASAAASKEEEEFFAAKKETKKSKAEGKRPTADRRRGNTVPEDYTFEARPQFWRLTPIMKFSFEHSLLDARAEDCQDCSGGGGGEGGGGELAAAALQAAAIALAAIIPAVVQADADIKTAKIQADAQLKQSQITAETSRYMADNQKKIAEQQAAISQQMSSENNAEQTKRLNLQLAELKDQRKEQATRQQEDRALEQQLNNERIALAKEQASNQIALAQQAFNIQLTQAGLQQGFGTATTKDRLTSDRVSSSGGSPVGTSSGLGGGNLASATGNALASAGIGETGQAMLKRGFASSRLVGAATRTNRGVVEEETSVEFAWVIDPLTGKKVRRAPKISKQREQLVASGSAVRVNWNRGMAGRGISKVNVGGISRLALGSGRANSERVMLAARETSRADLDQFAASNVVRRVFASSEESFATRQGRVPAAIGAASAHSGRGARAVTGARSEGARGLFGAVPSADVSSSIGLGEE